MNIKFFLFGALLLLINCSPKKESKDIVSSTTKIFKSLDPSMTGIKFRNTLTENDSLNYFTYSYLFMGGGVATGDINNDGLLDIYFTGNQVSNKLYLNRGGLKFEDVTKKSGTSGDGRWYTGVTMVDINNDGFLDIYCSVSGKYKPRNNQLFINKGDGTFFEEASKYGIDEIANSVQGTFFDYDNDGDLDLYTANYPPTAFKAPNFYYKFKMSTIKDNETDHLYRNDNNQFIDVTEESGVKSFGLSLSATIGDLNNDGWPDIYVSNDFSTPDYMYINNQNGTFNEVLKNATSHTSFYGMGTDIADYNNDGLLDIFQVDMSPESNRRAKANMASMNPALFWSTVNSGFHYQYMHNCMQLNSGVLINDIPKFSNVSRITGTSSTDWSWGPLFADFDNDGWKDLFISNGTRKEINNRDYFAKLEKSRFKRDSLLYKSKKIPSEPIDNYIFKNKGGLTFEKVNDEWGIAYKGFSNGCVYADLDNDGDLEIITNNIDDYASVFENKSSEFSNYLKIAFKGKHSNRFGLGNRVFIKSNEQQQMQELTLTRGFQSSVAPELHFGLGQMHTIDELKVIWYDGKSQMLQDVTVNQKLVLNYENAKMVNDTLKSKVAPLFETVVHKIPEFKAVENKFNDFSKQVLLPHKMSAFGPALAVGDLNGDQLADYFVGGAAGFSGALFFQSKTGFEKQENQVFRHDKRSEDIGAVIFDADQDGDQDLYVVSGGYEFEPNAKDLQDRLYLNDGKGNFSNAAPTVLPEMLTSGSRAYPIDFDKDGKEDLLVLGRQVPGNYPMPASSYLLKNTSSNGKAKFEDVTPTWAKEFKGLGMATSAVITDYNKDQWPDIMVVGEWMPIRVFQNTSTGFKEVSEDLGLTNATTGWWWSISEGDFDGDGDMDYLVGNNGLNYKYKATPEETFDIYVNDFDKNHKKDIVLSQYSGGEQVPVRGRECSSQQIPGIKSKFKNYNGFAEASLVDVYTEKALEASLHYQVQSFASVFMENKGEQFVLHQLPISAQLSSINQILVDDYDKDGNLDAVIAGNLYVSEVETPRNDAGYGLFLKGNGNKGFEAIPAIESGLYIPGDVKDMALIAFKNRRYILAAKNDDTLQLVSIKN